MPRIKRIVEKQNLDQYVVFKEDRSVGSRYFAVTDLPQTLTGGKNGFLITGTRELELGTTVKVEITDVDGNPVYYEVAQGRPQYYEGRSKVVSVWVYDDTPIGQGKITILGELRKYRNESGDLIDIPDEWKDNYNVRWEYPIFINKSLPNETRVRFTSRPIISVTENIVNLKKRVPTIIQNSGSLSGSAGFPKAGHDWSRFNGNTEYKLTISGSTFSELMVPSEGIITVSSLNQTYTTKLKKILSDTEALATTPYFITSSNSIHASSYKEVIADFSDVSFISAYTSESFETDPSNDGTASFATVTITNLETFSGDVHRIKLYRRPIGSTVETDYELVQDQVIEAREELKDDSKTGTEYRTGTFRTQATIDSYWNTSSFFITASNNDSTLFQSVHLTSSATVKEFTSGSTTFPATYTFTTSSASEFLTQILTYESRSHAGTGTFTGSVYYESESISSGATQSFYVSASTEISTPSFIANNGSDNTIFILAEVSSSLAGTSQYTGSTYAYSSSVKNEYGFNNSVETPYVTGSEYNVSFSTIGLGEGSLEVFLSGSSFNNTTGSLGIIDDNHSYGQLIGSVKVGGVRTTLDFSENFEPTYNGTGVLNFVIRGAEWYIGDVSLKEYHETNFSPNQFVTTIQIPTTINDQTYEFKSEFFDVNSNLIDITVVSDKQSFYGGSLFGKSVNFSANRPSFTFNTPDISGSFVLTANPIAQAITFTTSTRGLVTGSITYASQAFDDSGSLIPSASYETSSYVTFLSNATHSVATEANGTGGNYLGTTGSFFVFSANDNVSSGTTFTLSGSSAGVTASIDSTGLYTASLHDDTDSGTVTLSASIADMLYEHTFTVSKDKSGGSEKLIMFASPSPIEYQESGSTIPTSDTVTFTIQQESLSGTIISGDFTVKKNDGTNITTSSLVGSVVGGTGNQTFTSSFYGNNTSSLTLQRSDFPLTASVNRDSITDTCYLFSTFGADVYPGTMTDLTDSGGTMTVANFTGSDNGYTVGNVEITASSEGKYDAVSINTSTDGLSGKQVFIRPVFGTVLKNKDGGDPDNTGNLEIEIVKFVDGRLVSSSVALGNVRLYSASVELNTSFNGIGDGTRLADVRYNAQISGSAITGSLLLTAEDTGSGILWDSITLADLQDGLPAGYVTANTRVFKRDPNTSTYNINSIGLTGSFYIPNKSDGSGTTYNRYVSIDPNWNGSADQMSWSYDTGGTSDIEVIGNDLDGGSVSEDAYATTTDLSLTFTYTDPTYANTMTTEETFYITVEGLDGSGSIDTLAHTILPISGTYFSTNPNSGLHQPAYLEFKTQTTTSGSVTDIISGSTSYLRKQSDNSNITASLPGGTVYRITKDDIDSLEVFEWYSGSALAVVDTISVSDITDGTNSVSYLIRPFFGTVLKNKDGGDPSNAGNLEIQLVKVSGSQEYILNSGDIKLYSASVELVGSMNGISAGTATGSPYNGSGILPYHAQISGSAITGSLTIIAKSGSVVADTITLADLQDGKPAGYISTDSGRTLIRSGSNEYTPSTLGITGSFYIPNQSDGTGVVYSRYVGIDPNWTGTVDQMSWSYEPGGSTDIAVTVSDVDGNSVSEDSYANTKDLSVTFTYVDPTYGTSLTTEETFHVVSDGTDGIAAPSGILNLDDNNRVWQYSPNTGVYTPTDVTNGITASFYIGDTVTATRGWPITISGTNLQTGSENTGLRTDDWANVSIDVDGGGTSNMTIAFTSASITIKEQFTIVSEPRNAFGLSFSPESFVVPAGPTGDVISGLPNTVDVYLYVDGELETDYTTWTWASSSANMSALVATDKETIAVDSFTPSTLETALVSVTASKAYSDYTTTLQGSFTVTKAYQGRQGPGVVYIGDYDDLLANWPLQNDDVRRDIVTHGSTYYYYTGSDGDLKSTISSNNGHPTGSNTTDYWGTFTNFAAVATDILLAQDAYIGKVLNIGTNEVSGEANIALNGGIDSPYISLGQSVQNYAQSGFYLGSGSVSGETLKMSLSGSNGHMIWNGSNLSVKGAITVTGGNVPTTSSISGAFDTVSQSFATSITDQGISITNSYASSSAYSQSFSTDITAQGISITDSFASSSGYSQSFQADLTAQGLTLTSVSQSNEGYSQSFQTDITAQGISITNSYASSSAYSSSAATSIRAQGITITANANNVSGAFDGTSSSLATSITAQGISITNSYASSSAYSQSLSTDITAQGISITDSFASSSGYSSSFSTDITAQGISITNSYASSSAYSSSAATSITAQGISITDSFASSSAYSSSAATTVTAQGISITLNETGITDSYASSSLYSSSLADNITSGSNNVSGAFDAVSGSLAGGITDSYASSSLYSSSLADNITSGSNNVSGAFDEVSGSLADDVTNSYASSSAYSSSLAGDLTSASLSIFTTNQGFVWRDAAPTGTGLSLTATELGFHVGSTWTTYMNNDGNFYLNGTGGSGNGLSWNSGTNVLAVSGTIYAIGGTIGGVAVYNDSIQAPNFSLDSSGSLVAKNASFTGFVSASSGEVGGFTLSGTALTSVGGKITLDGSNDSISVRDSNGAARFLANTALTLPDPTAGETLTETSTTTTHAVSWANTGISSSIYVHPVTFSPAPTLTGTYTVSATLGAHASRTVYCGDSAFDGNGIASATVKLQIFNGTTLIAESGTRTITSYSVDQGWNTTVSWTSHKFTVDADLTSGITTYTAQWHIEESGGWFSAKPLSTVPDSSFNLAGETISATLELAKTTINGGGFQAVAAADAYLRVQDSTPAVLVVGQLSVTGSQEISTDLTVGGLTTTDHLTVGSGHSFGASTSNKIVARGSITSEESINALVNGSNNVLAQFLLRDSEGTSNSTGLAIAAVSGSGLAANKVYIAPVYSGSLNFGSEIYYDWTNVRWVVEPSLHVAGTLSKTAGSFMIDHPDPEKTDTHTLWHSFVESPTAGDNIYRFTVDVYDGSGWTLIPDYFHYLNTDVQIWVNAVDHFGRAYGKITPDKNAVRVYADTDGEYNVLVIATRKDEAAIKYWNGVEREKIIE